jgi:hypothetical protein
MRAILIGAVSLWVCSCGKSPEVATDSGEQSQIIQRIELLEERVETLIDQNAKDQARRRAEEQGFEVHEIEKK